MKNNHSNSTVAGRAPLVTVSLTKRYNKDIPVGVPNSILMNTVVTIASVRGYFKAETYSLRIEFDAPASIPCLHYDDEGELVDGETNALYLPVSVLLAQLCQQDARFACWFANRRDSCLGKDKHPFAPSVAEMLLTRADLVIQSEKFDAGEEYIASDGTTAIHNGSGYSHKIVGITWAADVDSRLNKFLPKDRQEILDELF